jgi:hypothetical protein
VIILSKIVIFGIIANFVSPFYRPAVIPSKANDEPDVIPSHADAVLAVIPSEAEGSIK